ncbi:hypothetical protein FJN17_34215 [Bradyrhizobium symbiodeficiens]|uniref:Uncharacterized protein n=1 Tax=Bradyrhizobium symbiodeficiens TaxID=1404367 RepID=A0ABZ2F0A8_9BRAD|nr:hypothetical protein [Bradyrhizobium symbiodeficiens]
MTARRHHGSDGHVTIASCLLTRAPTTLARDGRALPTDEVPAVPIFTADRGGATA